MSRVLIVEDSAESASYLATMLDGAGYTTLIATGVQEAKQHLAAGNIGLVITEYRLRDGDGIELIELIPTTIPVILITASPEDVVQKIGNQLPRAVVLRKPILGNTLLAIAKAMLALRLTQRGGGAITS